MYKNTNDRLGCFEIYCIILLDRYNFILYKTVATGHHKQIFNLFIHAAGEQDD